MKAVITLVRPRFVRSLVLAIALFGAALTASASVFVSVNFAPPPLPVYVQPICPGPEYIWVPGYWAYGPYGYYWVPGTWVLAPYVGALWTPGYWGWSGAVFLWHPGYWGPHVGFYGGIDYGFGYFGVGYLGGYWNNGAFYYNTAVTNVNLTVIHNTFSRPVTQNASVSRVSFNGGAGGTTAQPTAQERLAGRDHHLAATPLQAQHERLASTNRALLASVNHGTPTLTATSRAAAFGSHTGTGTVGAGRSPHVAGSHAGREFRAEPKAPHVAAMHPGSEFRAESNAPHVASPHTNREFRAERGVPHANAGPPQVERFSGPERHAQHVPRVQSMPAPQFHAQNAPRMQSMPSPERHAERGPRAQGQPHEGRAGEKRHEEGPGR
jgi:YXWGXW repeat-containing protein